MTVFRERPGLLSDRSAVSEMMKELRIRKSVQERFYNWVEDDEHYFNLGKGVCLRIAHRKRYGQRVMDITYRVGSGEDRFLYSFKVNSYLSKRDIIRFIEQSFYRIMFNRLVLQDKVIVSGKRISEWKALGVWDDELSHCRAQFKTQQISFIHTASFSSFKTNFAEWFEPVFIG